MMHRPVLAPRTGPRRFARRTGAAAVEFAFVAPVFLSIVFGIVEFGRAMMVLELLGNAARNGGRVGVLDQKDNAAILQMVSDSLVSTGVTGTTTQIYVNGAAVNASTARSGDLITVTVSVPFNTVSWLPVGQYLGGQTLASTIIMRRE